MNWETMTPNPFRRVFKGVAPLLHRRRTLINRTYTELLRRKTHTVSSRPIAMLKNGVLRGRPRVEAKQCGRRAEALRPKTDQTVCKPVLFRFRRNGDDHSSRPAIAGRLSRPTRTLSASDGLSDARPARGPYSVLLQAGLAMPSLSPGPRWALTPPFHPSRPVGRRFAFCGAIPGIAPGGRYPPPCHRGARTFLGVRRRRDRPTIWSGGCLTARHGNVNFRQR